MGQRGNFRRFWVEDERTCLLIKENEGLMRLFRN